MLTELYTVHRTELLKYCVSLCGSMALAEDLVQEVFIKALSNLGTLEKLSAKQRRAWLYKAARNLFFDACRRQNVEKKHLTRPEEAYEGGFSQVETAMILSKLPPELSALFIKRYFEGYNSNELAELYGLSPSGVRAALSRARKLLRDELTDQ